MGKGIFFKTAKSFRLVAPSRLFLAANLLFIAGVFLAGFRPQAFGKPLGLEHLAFYNGREMELVGRVCEEADCDYKSRRLTVCVSGRVSGRILITTDLYPVYDYGDHLKIFGEIEAPPEIKGFDYGEYLARYGVQSVMYFPKLSDASGELTAPQEAYRLLISFKRYLKSLIDSNLPEPEAGLANALLLGYRRTVDRQELDIFARVGLSHMIAISGSHITILSALVLDIFLAFSLGRRSALKAIFIFLMLYPLMTGLAASAVRSAIMGGLAFLAVYLGRASSMIRALVFSASVMLMINPRLLRDDIGFQLSFLAVLGIIFIYPLGERLYAERIEKLRSRGARRLVKTLLDTINLTLVSQIIILPIALINFHQLSLIAPLANLLVLWTFGPLLAFLVLAIFLSAFFPGLGCLWFLPVHVLLRYIFIASSLLAQPSWAAVAIKDFNWTWGIVYYSSLIVILKIIDRF